MKNQHGVTLIELAIVMVVISFLVGAVIQGQHMIYNARMQKVADDMQNYGRIFLVYYDQQGMYPGDENDTAFPAGDGTNGDHDSLIDGGEAANVWEDLANSMGVVRNTSPVRGGTYVFGNRSFFGAGNQNYISVTNIINRMAQSLDAKYDDGTHNTGNIQASAAYNGSENLITLYWRL